MSDVVVVGGAATLALFGDEVGVVPDPNVDADFGVPVHALGRVSLGIFVGYDLVRIEVVRFANFFFVGQRTVVHGEHRSSVLDPNLVHGEDDATVVLRNDGNGIRVEGKGGISHRFSPGGRSRLSAIVGGGHKAGCHRGHEEAEKGDAHHFRRSSFVSMTVAVVVVAAAAVLFF